MFLFIVNSESISILWPVTSISIRRLGLLFSVNFKEVKTLGHSEKPNLQIYLAINLYMEFMVAQFV